MPSSKQSLEWSLDAMESRLYSNGANLGKYRIREEPREWCVEYDDEDVYRGSLTECLKFCEDHHA